MRVKAYDVGKCRVTAVMVATKPVRRVGVILWQQQNYMKFTLSLYFKDIELLFHWRK